MKTKLLIVILISLTLKLGALTAPKLHCIVVNTNGSVTLTWATPTGTAGFGSYHIFRSTTAAGPYSDIGTVANVNQLSYTDLTINANAQSYYYYINSFTTTGTASTPIDTLQSMLLAVTNTGVGNAHLAWNPIHVPALNTTSVYYYIYRAKNTTTSWQFLDSTASLTYDNAVNVCHDTLNYRIEIKDATGCISVSSIDGDIFFDQTAPIFFGFDTASVSHTFDRVILGWQPSPSLDTKGYIICRGPICIALDTIWGRLNTFYIDTSSRPNTKSYTYRIAAFDSCDNTSTFSINHNSIFLQSSEDVCNNKINLSWNSYINLSPQILGYRVMMSTNGANYSSIANLATNVYSYTFSGLADSTNYCFYIQAYDSANFKTSSSNVKCHYITLSHSPKFLYIRHASVVNGYIELKVYTDTSVFIKGYKVLRSDTPGGPYSYIMTLPYNAQPNFTINDNSVDVMRSVYYYKIEVINSCGAKGSQSNEAHNILLTTKTKDNFTNELTWNEYGNWQGNVQSYDIYRSIDGGSNFSYIANQLVGTPPYTYLDDVSIYSLGNGKFSYYVMAKENPNAVFNFTEESYSNISEQEQAPYMYIPNAFCPKGLNKEFKPVSIFVSNRKFLMQIYNRFGQIIFETDNPDVGWDGKLNNEYVQSGVYVYFISYIKPDSEVVHRKGHVSVIY